MEPTPGQRKGAFALIVVALAGLGIFLVRPGASGSAGPASSPTASQSALPPPSPVATATQPPVAAPAPAAVPSATGPAGIYQWLPFTPAGLARAAAAAT